MMYFPHAFVVVGRQASSDKPAIEEAYGFTAASDWDPTVLIRPSRGAVEQPDPVYRKRAVLHFTVMVTDEQYAAVRGTVAAWGGPASPLYDLRKHNCVGFVAEVAQSAGLKTPDLVGEDPGKFLNQVRRLNPSRLTVLAESQSESADANP